MGDRPLDYLAMIHREEKRGISFMEKLIAGDRLVKITFPMISGEWSRCSEASMGVGLAMEELSSRGPCRVSIEDGLIELLVTEQSGGVELLSWREVRRQDDRTLLTLGGSYKIDKICIGALYLTKDGELVALSLKSLYRDYRADNMSQAKYISLDYMPPSYSLIVCTR